VVDHLHFSVRYGRTYLYVSTLTPEYEARSTIFVDLSQQNEIPGFGTGEQRSAVAMSDRLAADIAIVQRSSDLAEQVARRLISVGFSPYDGEQLPDSHPVCGPGFGEQFTDKKFQPCNRHSFRRPANYEMLDVPRVARRIPVISP
jgi:hypothetical protein